MPCRLLYANRPGVGLENTTSLPENGAGSGGSSELRKLSPYDAAYRSCLFN